MKKRVQRTARASATASATATLPRPAKGWIHINIGRREIENLRALAHCLGTTLRTFLELTIRCQAYKEADRLKINKWRPSEIPMERRKAMARRNFEINRAIGWRGDNYRN